MNRFHALPDNTKGALILLVAAMGFSIMAMLIKLAGQNLHVTQILLVRQFGMTALILPSLLGNFPHSLKTRRPDLQLLRIGFAIVAMLCGFTALIELPLADATALAFTKGLFVTIFAVLILKETVGWFRWGAVIVGFAGVLMMLRPGTDDFSVYGVLAIIGAASAGIVMIIIRLLSRHDHPNTIMTYQAFGVGVIMLVPGVWFWKWPSATEWIILGAIAVSGFVAQKCNVYAHKWGEASMLASLDYTRLFYATVLGWLVFDTFPDSVTWIGAGIIIAASIFTVYREHALKRERERGLEDRFG